MHFLLINFNRCFGCQTIGRQDDWEKDHWATDVWATDYWETKQDDWATAIYLLCVLYTHAILKDWNTFEMLNCN